MSPLSDAELYAFFFALHEHEQGDRKIAGLEIDAEFARALNSISSTTSPSRSGPSANSRPIA